MTLAWSTSAMLKRSILRFADDRTLASEAWCGENDNRCEEAREQLGIPDEVALEPRLRREEPKPKVSVESNALPKKQTVEQQANYVLLATDYCTGAGSCSLTVINRIASVLVTTGANDKAELTREFFEAQMRTIEAALGETKTSLAELKASVQGLKGEVAEYEATSRQRIEALLAQVDGESRENSELRVSVIDMLAKAYRCQHEVESARKERESLLRAVTGNATLACNKGWQSQSVDLGDGTQASVDYDDICTLGGPVEIDWPADALFGTCEGETIANSALLDKMAAWMQRVQPTRLEIRAYTDPREPSYRARADGRPCRSVYRDNGKLVVERGCGDG